MAIGDGVKGRAEQLFIEARSAEAAGTLLAAHYTQVFREAGITKFRFVITPRE